MSDALTARQQREIAYHQEHAALVADRFSSVNFEVVTSPRRRWWNAYWDVWTQIIRLGVAGKSVLVVGCGAGEEAMFFAKLGARVSAFDLSPDMLEHGRRLAQKYGLSVAFDQMPAEAMRYPDNTFDLVFAQDILHHVDVASAMSEIKRVAKPRALFVINEIYSHSFADWFRNNRLVERVLYPALVRFVYQNKKPYITEDERKLKETDLANIRAYFRRGAGQMDILYEKYFDFIVTRLLPDKYVTLNKIDRAAISCLGRAGRFVGGRAAIIGRLPPY